MLHIVSSAQYGAYGSIRTVAQAVHLLGFDALKHVVLAASVISLFQKTDETLLPPLGYWQHSLGRAIASRHIALRMGEELPEEFFVAGLLHDLGKFGHSQHFSQCFEEALTLAASERLSLISGEERLFGFSHADIQAVFLSHIGGWHQCSSVPYAHSTRRRHP